jgi:hypothetical protein
MSALWLLLVACSTPPQVQGKVVDIWGHPVEGATVMMVGQGEKPLTDAEGRYRLPVIEGTHELKAGRKGYIQSHAELTVAPGQAPDGPLFELYPMPEDPGFYAVTTNEYTKLKPLTVHSVGNELRSYRGLKNKGDVSIDTDQLEVVFHTELTHDEVMRLGLQLRKLEYRAEGEVPGPLRPTTVKVGLYTDAGEVPIDITPMKSRTDYRITPKKELERGIYAFQTQHLLDSQDQKRFEQLPDELRKVYPVELR